MNNYIKVHQPLNVDLRTQKTQTKLYTVLERFYLEGRTFESISIKDLCEQAQISRATFTVIMKRLFKLLKSRFYEPCNTSLWNSTKLF